MEKTVLIVEDEFLLALDLKILLEGYGWRVMGPAASVAAAMSLLEHELPSVALLDVNLGNEMVTPLAENLKMRCVPFALASAVDDPERHCGTVMSGVPNVGKPTSERRLKAALEELTGCRAAPLNAQEAPPA
jgi:DNA-binding response OmpR family regulator